MSITNAKSSIIIVHNTPAIIWNAVCFTIHLGKLWFPSGKVIPQDSNIIVPIRSTHFMIEPISMKEFMSKTSVMIATDIDWLVRTMVTSPGRTSSVSDSNPNLILISCLSEILKLNLSFSILSPNVRHQFSANLKTKMLKRVEHESAPGMKICFGWEEF